MPPASQAKAEIRKLMQALDAAAEQAQDLEGQAADGCEVAAGAAPAPPPTAAAPPTPSGAAPGFGEQYELRRVWRERDEATARDQAQLRQERNDATAEARQLRSALERLQREHAALREAHATAQLRAEQQAAQSAAELAGRAEALERLQAAQAQLAASDARKELRIGALETKQAILLECYKALEAEQQQAGAGAGSGSAAQEGQPLAAAQQRGLCGARPLQAAGAAAGTAAGQAGELDSLERLAASGSYWSLAVRCADLTFQMEQQRREAVAAQRAVAAAEEHAAGLRFLLDRQQVPGGGMALLEQRLEAACRQLEEARGLGEKLQRQLNQERRPYFIGACALPAPTGAGWQTAVDPPAAARQLVY
jgi:hypothetical protein